MTKFEEVFKSGKLDPSQYFDGTLWGYSFCEVKCKICNSCSGNVRSWIEFFVRSGVSYSTICELITEGTDGKLLLNKVNVHGHATKHMPKEDLILPVFLPDEKSGPLVPRWWLVEGNIPYETRDGKLLLSKCCLGFTGCEWLNLEGEPFCSYANPCPVKDKGTRELIQQQRANAGNPIIDACPICRSPYRRVIEALGSEGGDQ